MTLLSQFSIGLVAFCAISLFAAAPTSKFESLLKGADLFGVPKDVKKVMRLGELYEAISVKGVKIRQGREDYNSALDAYRTKYNTLNFPVPALSFGLNSSKATYSNLDGTFSNTSSTGLNAGLALSGSTGWGLSYSFGLPSITQGVDTYGNLSSSINLGLTNLSFSLLKGSIFALGRNQKNQADIGMNSAKYTLKTTVLSSIKDAESAYYDVLLKQIRVQVLEQAMASAQALLSDVKEMVAAGESDRLSVLKTELQIAQGETDLLAARIDLTNSRQTLRELIALRIDENLDIYPDPNELKANRTPPELDATRLMERAKATRPAYLAALGTKRAAELAVQSAFSDILPSLDVQFRYSYNGTAASLADAQTQLFQTPSSYVGFSFSYPLFNDPAQASYRQAKFGLHKAEVQVEEAHNAMMKEINQSIIGVDMGQRRLKMAEMSRQLSEKKLQAEFEKFKVGESAIRNITDYQKEVNDARINEISARVAYFTALSSLRTSIGDLPEGVSLSFAQ